MTQQRAFRQYIILLVLLVTLGLLQLPHLNAASQTDGSTFPSNVAGTVFKPITVHGSISIPSTFNGDEHGGFWLSNLTDALRQAPNALALAWAPQASSWFGAVWRISLTSSAGLIPAALQPKEGSGFLQNQPILEIEAMPPIPGHTYTVQLSYDPQTGAAAATVYDATSAQTVAERGWQLLSYNSAVYVAGDHGTEPATSPAQPPLFEITAVLDYFVPSQIRWQLVETNSTGNTSGSTVLQMIRRNSAIALALDMPWTQLPGQLQLTIVGPDSKQYLFPISNLAKGSLTPLPLRDLAAGVYHLVLDYTEGQQRIVLSERAYPVGVVDASLQSVRLQQLHPNRVAISGTLRLRADGPMQPMDVSLLVDIDSLQFVVDAAKLEGKIGTGEITTTPIHQATLRQLSPAWVNVPINVEVDLPQTTHTPYGLIQLTVRPQLHADIQLQMQPFTQRLRLTPVDTTQKTPADHGLRVMSYNIRTGRGMDDHLDLQRIADEIAYSGADIIGLNEVDQQTMRSGWVDQATELAGMLGMHVAFGANISYQGGLYGNAILSRYPLKQVVNEHLPTTGGERRGVMHAQVDYEGTTVHFLVTHLGLSATESALQLARVVQLAESLPGPVILVGDFNMRAGSAQDPTPYLEHLLQDAWQQGVPLAKGLNSAGISPVYSNFEPDRRIDYVWISRAFEIRNPGDVFTIDSLASDHRPVVAELHFRQGAE